MVYICLRGRIERSYAWRGSPLRRSGVATESTSVLPLRKIYPPHSSTIALAGNVPSSPIRIESASKESKSILRNAPGTTYSPSRANPQLCHPLPRTKHLLLLLESYRMMLIPHVIKSRVNFHKLQNDTMNRIFKHLWICV